MSRARLTACVMLPFAAGYFLSYLFRTINAVIANDLAADLNLGAAELGMLTSIYFLVFAAVQLPFGALLDRNGPKIIQSTLLLLASAGALVFALAEDFACLVVGRVLLALGVALALMAGFKAIVVWFPAGRVVVANGWLVMLGALGAVTATAPAELAMQMIGWRRIFAALAVLSTLAALFVLLAVPDQCTPPPTNSVGRTESRWAVYQDRRFWRIAPLSSIGIGTSWSLQSLWAAPWLRDVDGLDRSTIVQHLSVMAVAICVGALLLGTVANRLRRVGFKTELLLATTVTMSMAAQSALVLGCRIPSLLLWTVIAATGAATVLSFAILAEYYPREVSGRANAALNLLHMTAAFVLQSAAGIIIAQWPETNGAYALEAHQAAMTAGISVQLVALSWFALPRHALTSASGRASELHSPARGRPSATKRIRHLAAPFFWGQLQKLHNQHAASWRLAAVAAAIVCVGISTVLWTTISRSAITIHVVVAGPFSLASANLDIPDFPSLPRDHRLSPTWARADMPMIGRQSIVMQPGDAAIVLSRHP